MAQPHFLLFCDAHVSARDRAFGTDDSRVGRWHFMLEQIDGTQKLEAADAESRVTRDRLDLLAVVRGLEALEQPSQVTLVTTSRYVARGLRYGLGTWRESDYRWERFGVQMPIRNADLWQRIDVAMNFHGLNCRYIRTEQPRYRTIETRVQSSNNRGSTSFPQCRDELLTAMPAAEPLPSESSEAESAGFPSNGLAAISSTATGSTATGSTENGGPISTRPCRRRGLNTGFCPPGVVAPVAWISQDFWWKLAISWIRWWKGRLQRLPAIYGT